MGEAEYKSLIATDPDSAAKLFVDKDRQIELLTNHLINANKARFGTKSEKLPVGEQGTLFAVEEAHDAGSSSEEAASVEVPAHTRSASRKRRVLPEGTVVRRIEHPPVETTCTACGRELVKLREEVTKIISFIPAHFELEEHARPVMACACCRESAPVTTPLPSGIQLIPRSPVGVGLLTSILISKYQDHLPLHRQEEMFARLGYEVPRKRMCEWLGALAELCQPLYKAIKRILVDVKVALEIIARLYKAEPKDRTLEVVQAARSTISAPLLHELHKYLTGWSKRTLPRSPVQKAIQYALSQWEALTVFLTHPDVMLDNNLIENQMRPIALGRKNWLFAASHEGAMRAAIFFSLINSCRMNNVNTWQYFTDVLPRLASTPSEDLPTLLPHAWKHPVNDGA